MEHLTDIKAISDRTGITDPDKIKLLTSYAESIYSENQKHNLTGHKTLEDIIENLIIGSLEPVKDIDVPRGTLFADIGTGAGIPGIPLAIKHSESTGILFDSNQKKIRFINKTASELGIKNVKAADIRVEDAGRMGDYRGKFDIVFTRAMSDIYTIAELASPLLKTGGFIFLYANIDSVELSDSLVQHLSDVGLSGEIEPVQDDLTDGILLRKIKETDNRYPRRMPVIKRMAAK